MKKSFKWLAIFICLCGEVAHAGSLLQEEPHYDGYLFAYFEGRDGDSSLYEQIRFAVSADGIQGALVFLLSQRRCSGGRFALHPLRLRRLSVLQSGRHDQTYHNDIRRSRRREIAEECSQTTKIPIFAP